MERKALWVSRIFGFVASEVYSPLCSFRLSLLVCLFLRIRVRSKVSGLMIPLFYLADHISLENGAAFQQVNETTR